MAAKKGRQTPTISHVLPYDRSWGAEAIRLYERSGNKALPWQKNLVRDLMAVNSDKLWTHMKFGYTLPRRNGKSEVCKIRIIWGLEHGEKIMYTAHRTSTSATIFRELCQLLDNSGLEEGRDYHSVKASGKENITFLQSGGRVDFRTRSGKGGLGEGFDLLLIDEAQEYTDNQETALKYICTASANPQTLFCGTPPTAESSGTVFTKYREEVMSGAAEDSYWGEWSIPEMSDVRDVSLWYETNPSLGYHLTERNVRGEIGKNDVDFNIQRLGLWIKYNQKSAISPQDWEACQVSNIPKFTGKLYVAVKFGIDDKNAALAVAVKTEDMRIFVEVIDCVSVRNGNIWILDFLKNADIEKIIIDGKSRQNILAHEMKDYGIRKKPVLPEVKDVTTAASVFEQGIFSNHLIHAGQPSLADCVSHCDKRAIGSSGGFGFKSQMDDIDISLLDSVMLAYWACASAKVPRKQRVRY